MQGCEKIVFVNHLIPNGYADAQNYPAKQEEHSIFQFKIKVCQTNTTLLHLKQEQDFYPQKAFTIAYILLVGENFVSSR